MTIRGKLYKFFPVNIDTDDSDGCSDIEDSWQWSYFNWYFHLLNFVSGWMYGNDNQFPIMIPESELKKLTKKERAKLDLYN